MANYIVSIDHDHANVIALREGAVEQTLLRRKEIRHHTGYEKAQTNHKNAERFFHDVAAHLGDAHEVLLVGPGMAKDEFKKHLVVHHHDRIAKKVVGTETIDHPTDGQIVALGRKFFKGHLRLEE